MSVRSVRVVRVVGVVGVMTVRLVGVVVVRIVVVSAAPTSNPMAENSPMLDTFNAANVGVLRRSSLCGEPLRPVRRRIQGLH